MHDGAGYWLNPATGATVKVFQHAITMANPVELKSLGVAPEVIAKAAAYSPFSREGEDALRMLGIEAGLVRVRDHRDLVTAQFAAPRENEAAILQFVLAFFESHQFWRPWIKIGNFHTGKQAVISWAEFVARCQEKL